jgi:hypothetical protein
MVFGCSMLLWFLFFKLSIKEYGMLELRVCRSVTNFSSSLVSLQVGCTSVCCAVFLALLKINENRLNQDRLD